MSLALYLQPFFSQTHFCRRVSTGHNDASVGLKSALFKRSSHVFEKKVENTKLDGVHV